MTMLRRILALAIAALLVAAGVIILAFSELGYLPVIIMLAAVLIATGIRYLVYFFNMSRHMVGGRSTLYIAVILLDLGVFSISLADAASFYVILYLFGTYALTGGIDILRALEAKKYNSKSWKFGLVSGIINLAVAFACFIFVMHTEIVIIIFALGLFYSALQRVISAFRRTSVVYVQ